MNYDQAQISVTLRAIARNHLRNAREMSRGLPRRAAPRIALQAAKDARAAAYHVRHAIGPSDLWESGLTFAETIQLRTALSIIARRH